VLFTVLDALPARHVGPDHTPVLHDFARAGGWALDGGRAVMTSATYPNHATFSTGTEPRRHGIVTNWVPEPGRVVPAWKLGPRVPTLFDACRTAGRTTAAVFGDQHLVGVMGAGAADRHWPLDGVPPDGLELDEMGYLHDRDTVAELVRALDDEPDLVIAQINGPDTAAHLHGPDSDAALAGYRDTDALLALVREHVAWDETVWILVSDHDQEPVTEREPIDLQAETVWILVSDHDQEPVTEREPIDLQAEIDARGLPLFALPEGNASVVCGEGARGASAWIEQIGGVEGTEPFDLGTDGLECGLVWTEPGRAFGFAGTPTRLGTHGGPRTRAQVAVVTGGHPMVEHLAHAMSKTPIEAADWAPTIASLLEVGLPSATGRALVT
jgi:arylsulfatase A-like enzyme